MGFVPFTRASYSAKRPPMVAGVFRYLDTSHDGDISRKEFETLERVWRELQQSMYEPLGRVSRLGPGTRTLRRKTTKQKGGCLTRLEGRKANGQCVFWISKKKRTFHW